jgi:hypothetical protein
MPLWSPTSPDFPRECACSEIAASTQTGYRRRWRVFCAISRTVPAHAKLSEGCGKSSLFDAYASTRARFPIRSVSRLASVPSTGAHLVRREIVARCVFYSYMLKLGRTNLEVAWTHCTIDGRHVDLELWDALLVQLLFCSFHLLTICVKISSRDDLQVRLSLSLGRSRL